MKIWPFDPAAQENQGLFISAAQMKKAIEPFEKIRKAVGDRMEIMVEFHSLWNLPTAKQIAKALEPYAPTWYEDPIRMNSPQALAEYARSTDVWVCASETLGSRYPYKDMLERDAIHVVMVDLCWTGGLTEGRKIAALAETWHRPFAPHDCIGPVGFVAAVHASFSQPNTLIQESVRAFYTGWYKRARDRRADDQGRLRLSDGRAGPRRRAAPGRVRAPRPDACAGRRPEARSDGATTCSIFMGARRSSPARRAASGARWRRAWRRPAPAIVLNGSDPGRLASAAAEMRAAGHTVHEACFDVTDEPAIVAAFARFDAEGVAIDILVNNAGIQLRKPMVELVHRRVAKGHRHQPDQRLRDRARGRQADDPARRTARSSMSAR